MARIVSSSEPASKRPRKGSTSSSATSADLRL